MHEHCRLIEVTDALNSFGFDLQKIYMTLVNRIEVKQMND